MRDFSNPLLESVYRFRRDLALRLLPAPKLNPRNFRCCGFATALFDSFTLSFSFSVMNRFTLSITRCPAARSVRT
jgi:hypothetical protein